MAKQEDIFKKVVSHAKEYGFIFPSSEIYDGLSAVYDYGQNGAELKNNIKQYWWKAMVQLNENIVGLDAAILMHPTTWKASGHVDAFNDPLIDNKDSKKRFRADVLIEDYCAKLEDKAQKEIEKAAKRFGDAFDKAQFEATNPRVLEYREKQKTILARMAKSLENNDLADVKALIEELEIADPDTGSKNWTDVRQFNLMFGTKLGASAENAMDLYLRPETAQGIFVNFLNVQKTSRHKLPFGIAQIGKAFRNEIVARQFIFRMREFEQMEMQFFVPPGTELKFYEEWKQKRLNWHLALGLGQENYKFHDHEKLAHYANAAAGRGVLRVGLAGGAVRECVRDPAGVGGDHAAGARGRGARAGLAAPGRPGAGAGRLARRDPARDAAVARPRRRRRDHGACARAGRTAARGGRVRGAARPDPPAGARRGDARPVPDAAGGAAGAGRGRAQDRGAGCGPGQRSTGGNRARTAPVRHRPAVRSGQ